MSGWLKRGPSGIVGTNINDARDTVACIRHDFDRAGKERAGEAQAAEEKRQAVRALGIGWEQFSSVDAEEVRRGGAEGKRKPREKIVKVAEAMEVARA